MLALLAEDKSDVDALAVIVRMLAKNPKQSILTKGFNGCGELRRKAVSHILQFRNRGATRFVICHDADRANPAQLRQQLQIDLLKKAQVEAEGCIVIPVQEIEAWILADAGAISKVIPKLQIPSENRPENIVDPKEYLVRASKGKNSKPLYIYAVHNARVAAHLDLSVVAQKCPSFVVLRDFIQANYCA